jgi:hypothetical protein
MVVVVARDVENVLVEEGLTIRRKYEVNEIFEHHGRLISIGQGQFENIAIEDQFGLLCAFIVPNQLS